MKNSNFILFHFMDVYTYRVHEMNERGVGAKTKYTQEQDYWGKHKGVVGGGYTG